MRFSCIIWFSTSILLSVLSATTASGQTTFSPYSQFGLGLDYDQHGIQSLSMGGQGATWSSPYEVNTVNPASYSFLFRPTFQVASRSQLAQFNSEGEQVERNVFGLHDLSIGIPMGKGWGMAVALKPLTNVNYSLSQEDSIPGFSTISTYLGEGGVSRLTVGLSKRKSFGKRAAYFEERGKKDSTVYFLSTLSIGVNGNFDFGQIAETKLFDFTDGSVINSGFINETVFRRQSLGFGFQYRQSLVTSYNDKGELTRKFDILSGGSLSAGNNMKREVRSILFYQNALPGNGLPIDTTVTGDPLNIPTKLNLGISLDYIVRDHNWKLNMNYQSQDWTETNQSLSSSQSQLGASTTASLGLQFIPNIRKGKALTLASYRAGVRSSSTYLNINGKNITDEAVSIGISIPLIASYTASQFHFGTELGRRGTVSDNLIEENYLNFYLGFTLTPSDRTRWFAKRKYN